MRRIAAIAFLLVAMPLAAQATRAASLTGKLLVLWGDRPHASAQPPAPRYQLVTDRGDEIRLIVDKALGATRFNKRRVTVTGEWVDDRYRVATIAPATDGASEDISPAVTGAQPWVTVMCKFQDLAEEQKTLSYFQNMYASSYPGFDHHWREQSYDLINVAGSSASGWYTLPHPRSFYVGDFNGDGEEDVDLDVLRDECISVSDASVNFSSFAGINMMFNADLDCCAWGGSSSLTLDGVSRSWRTTWNPPWSFEDVAVVAHEMGHGFGLPHSSGEYGDVYDNRWDIMSDTWTDCAQLTDPTYGCLGQHTIAYHKDALEWIVPAKKYTLSSGEAQINLERIAQPSTSNYLMGKIPYGTGGRFYTVEVRQQVGYDVKLPGAAVIIHDVDPAREEPAHVVDADGNGDTGDAGAIWTVGETFSDAVNGVAVRVDAAIPNGFTVTLSKLIQTTTALAVSQNPALPNSTVTLTASVTNGATGNVTFRDNGVTIGNATLSGGVATLNTPFSQGTHPLTAVYAGSGTHSGSTSNTLSFQAVSETLTINDVSVTEGNSGTTNAVFTVTVSPTSGVPVTVQYRVAAGTASGSTVGTNAAKIVIPSGGDSPTYPSSIAVSGAAGTISKMTLTLDRVSHTFPQDIDILLVGPNGTAVTLMSDAGGHEDATDAVLTFDDAAVSFLTSSQLTSGTFKPTNLDDGEGADVFSSPAPSGPYGSTLAAFNGISPNGTWSLYLVDDYGGDAGEITGGWSVSFETTASDYAETFGTLVIPYSTATATVSVPIKGDTLPESNETFTVLLSNATNAVIVDGTGIGTILNDDGTGSAPVNLLAGAVSPTQVTVIWTAVGGATSYRIYRSSNGSTFTQVGTSATPSFNDTTALANTAYLYKVRTGTDGETPFSNVDLATTVSFTDAVLTASTPIKLAHFNELLTAVNAVRGLAGLSGIAYSAPAPALGVTVRRQHLLDLRNALIGARSILGLPAVTYTDDVITAGSTRIKTAHVTDLRGATQ